MHSICPKVSQTQVVRLTVKWSVESYLTTEVPHSTANAASVNCNEWPPVVTCGSITVISKLQQIMQTFSIFTRKLLSVALLSNQVPVRECKHLPLPFPRACVHMYLAGCVNECDFRTCVYLSADI